MSKQTTEIVSLNIGWRSDSGAGDHSTIVSGTSAEAIANQIEQDAEFGEEGYSQRLYPETDEEFLLAGEVAKILRQRVSVSNRNMPDDSALSDEQVEAILFARA